MDSTSEKMCAKSNSVSVSLGLCYALPVGATSILYGGPLIILQGIYAKHYGVSLVAISAVLLAARLFDTITDPIIGYWSDRYHARNGTRKPFVLLGAIVFILSAYFLFNPSDEVSLVCLSLYFFAFYLGYTLFNVPHYAWGSELSTDSQSSTRLFTLRAVMMSVGLLIFYAIPQLPLFGSTEFNPEVLQFAVVATAILLLPALYFCLCYVPTFYSGAGLSSNRLLAGEADSGAERYSSLLALWKNIRHNKPFLIFLSAFLLWGVGLGSWVGLLYIFIDSYLVMGKHFSLLAFIGVSGSVVLVPLFSKLAQSQGKITAWIVSSLITAVSILVMGLLDPKNPSFAGLAISMILAYLGAMSFMIFAPALLSDIVDYGAWKNRSQFTGSYFSLFLLATKFNEAVGIALGLAIAGAFGFDPSQAEHSESAVLGIQIAGVWLPSTLLILSIAIIKRIPINARRHAVICKALSRREKRAIALNETSKSTSIP